MPRVNIEHVVSFSSEDPEYSAQRLVRSGPGVGEGWRCARGECGRPAAVELQLARAARVSSLAVGCVRAATLEVLAGLGASAAGASQRREVLAPACVLLSPAESRRAEAGGDGARVRTFGPRDLCAAAAARPWDRLRLVLTQPYNKHVQFGLSFVHVYEPEPPGPARPLPAALEATDDDGDEEFRPGELFAKRKDALLLDASPQPPQPPPAPATEVQIKQATSQALNNVDHPATKLKRVAIVTAGRRGGEGGGGRETGAGGRETDGGGRERGGVLSGVVFSLSGYQHPQRGRVRRLAERLGATHGEPCTHLICAFPNTPKLRALQAAAGAGGAGGGGGGEVVAVEARWVRWCAAEGSRLPWRWWATLPKERTERPKQYDGSPPPSPPPPPPPPDDDELDTDDEIERVTRASATPAAPVAPVAPADDGDGDDDAAYDALTPPPASRVGLGVVGERALPLLWPGRRMAGAGGTGADEALVARYVRAYGGHYLRQADLEDGLSPSPDYWLGGEGERARGLPVRLDWLWRCHAARRLLPLPPLPSTTSTNQPTPTPPT